MRENDAYNQRVKFLDKIISMVEPKLKDLPGGNIRINKKGKKIQYYYITEKGDTKGHYLKKAESELACKIVQRDYYRKLIKEAKRERKAIVCFMKGMEGIKPEEVYEELNENRKALVNSFIQSDEEFVKEWLAEEYRGNPYYSEEKVYETKRGEKVRTKSEVLLANMYYEMGVPYKYEYPKTLYNGKTKYPDFVLLKMPERKEILHEHMGLLEDKEYRQSNLIKINDYAKSGIYLGDNLILTFETDYAPLVISDVEKMTKKLFSK